MCKNQEILTSGFLSLSLTSTIFIMTPTNITSEAIKCALKYYRREKHDLKKRFNGMKNCSKDIINHGEITFAGQNKRNA
jgi:hypothetical protein